MKSKMITMLAGLGFLMSVHAYAMSPVEMILVREVIERVIFNPVDTIRGAIDALGRLIPNEPKVTYAYKDVKYYSFTSPDFTNFKKSCFVNYDKYVTPLRKKVARMNTKSIDFRIEALSLAYALIDFYQANPECISPGFSPEQDDRVLSLIDKHKAKWEKD